MFAPNLKNMRILNKSHRASRSLSRHSAAGHGYAASREQTMADFKARRITCDA
jgi:hypothetical protein